MTILELHNALTTPVDQLGALLRAPKVVEFLNAAHEALQKVPMYDDAIAKIAVLEERLKKATEREDALKQKAEADRVLYKKQIEELRADCEKLRSNNEELKTLAANMQSHPDVQRAQRAQLAAQMKELEARLQAIPNPDPED